MQWWWGGGGWGELQMSGCKDIQGKAATQVLLKALEAQIPPELWWNHSGLLKSFFNTGQLDTVTQNRYQKLTQSGCGL